jgi:endonuclease/exonuclease/phosphatase family metal-dependent hydrolase
VILLAVVAVASGCGGGGATGDADRVVTFNLCGNVCAGGDAHGDGIRFIASVVQSEHVDAVALQEVCRTQAEAVRDALVEVWGSADVEYATTFAGDLGGANRCDGDDYGIAVLAPALGDVEIEPLPNPGLGETQIDERVVLCADTPRFELCTTHLVRRANDASAHEAQVSAFIDIALRRNRVVLAGDLNDRVGTFAALAERGAFVSGRQAGDAIDHVFASSTTYAAVRLLRRSCDCSDHDALVATLERRSVPDGE